MSKIESKIKELNIKLPDPKPPVGAYVATKIVGNLLFISGQISADENLNLILETISDKNVPQDKPKNLLKRLSTFFADDKINKTQIHPKINLKKEILENNEMQIDEDQIQKTISKDSDLFSIEKQSEFKDHQIDLIDMDQQNQEIDEDVLEIPAFLRRQAN